MVLMLLLPFLAPILAYAFGGVIAIALVSFFLKQILQIAFVFVALLLFVNYAKHSHEYKGNNAMLVLIMAFGFLLTPLFINVFGHFFGIASFSPILSYSAVSGTGDLTIGSTVLTNFDLGFLLVFLAVLFFAFTKQGQKIIKDVRKKL